VRSYEEKTQKRVKDIDDMARIVNEQAEESKIVQTGISIKKTDAKTARD